MTSRIKFQKRNALLVTSLLVSGSLLIGCGGSSDSSDDSNADSTTTNILPTVEAGSEQNVNELTLVTLTGSATDSDGSISSYLWQQTSGTNVTINNNDSATASFTAPEITVDETLTFTLTATDNDGGAISDEVNINVANVENNSDSPIANAGNDQTVFVGATVTLSGTQSTGPANSQIDYSWNLSSIPSGSLASLSDESSVAPSFVADVVGSYTAYLTVSDGQMTSESDSVEITVTEVVAGSTNGVYCNYSYDEYNSSASVTTNSTVQWTCADGERNISANGIPDHDVGTFPNSNNPNTIEEQSVTTSYTLTPEETETATTLGGPSGPTGFVLNGVKIDANTAGSCDDSGTDCSLAGNIGNWSIEALGQTSFNFGTDNNNAHVQPGGAYHYHGMPEGFITKQGGNASTMTLIGWAADGFPIYARYGYSIASDASSAIISMTGSYQHVSTVSSSRPSVDVYPLGTFKQDWEYVEGSGDLDECNGRIGVTPEFPSGIYHYYATDSYPYFQRCVKGEVDAAGSPPP